MPRKTFSVFGQNIAGGGFDWLVHYRNEDEQGFISLFDHETVIDALDAALTTLDGEGGENLGTYEIIGILRRDMVNNAQEILGGRRPN